MNPHDIENQLLDAINQFEGRLPGDQLKDMRELARAGEPGIALENLCTQACEYDLSIQASLASTLKRLGSAMAISPKHGERLQVE